MTKERELYEKTYPAKEVNDNPYLAIEAFGYLKHLKISNPEQSNWIDVVSVTLLMTATIDILSV